MSKHYFDPRLKIFSLNSNRPLAEKIADAVGVELGKCSVTQFSDGEIQVNIEESIRGAHVYVIQSTSSPVNDNLMELLIMIDALKRASAKTINVVMPYYGYARQDRKARAREPITAKLVANMIEKAGATRMLTLDLHAVQIQGFFDIPVDYLMGAPLIAIIDKRRPKANVAEVMNIIGHVEGKTCVLIDDMIDTAGTISLAANALKEAGAKDVYASCTHPVLSGPALQRIEDSAIERLVVTDSIYLSDDRKIAKIDEVSVGELIGDAIKRIHENKPVSPLFETKNK